MQNQLLPEGTPAIPSISAETTVAPPTMETSPVSQEDTAAVALLQQARQKVRQRNRRLALTIPLIGLVTTLLALLPVLLFQPSSPEAALALTIYLATLTAIAGTIISRDSKQGIPFSIEELTRAGGMKAIGPLLEALQMNITRRQAKTLYTALIPLLLQLKASDAYLLTPAHRFFLHNMLQLELQGTYLPTGTAEGLRLKLAILKAFEQVGDEKALPIVQRLANLKSRSSRQQQLRYAAKECLPHLQAIMHEVTANRTLLRASSAETAAPETLLRPATAGNTLPAAQLLRPSDAS